MLIYTSSALLHVHNVDDDDDDGAQMCGESCRRRRRHRCDDDDTLWNMFCQPNARRGSWWCRRLLLSLLPQTRGLTKRERCQSHWPDAKHAPFQHFLRVGIIFGAHHVELLLYSSIWMALSGVQETCVLVFYIVPFWNRKNLSHIVTDNSLSLSLGHS